MLGANKNPQLFDGDKALKELAKKIDREKEFNTTNVGVYFGSPGETVKDPYFKGKGPNRTGCIHCGACMTGCRHNAKNTLDKNYLYLAQQLGAKIIAEDGTFLGTLDDSYESDSIYNDYSEYGNDYNSDSIWNDYSDYGSDYSSQSPFNDYASDPPILLKDGEVVGKLTTDPYDYDAVDPRSVGKDCDWSD